MERMSVRKYRSTAQDRMQHISRHICDQQIHVLLEFDSPLDDARLKRATRLLPEVEPILACRWVDGRRPYWQRKEGAYAIPSFLLTPCDDPLAEAMHFITTRSDPGIDPLVQCHLFRGERDILCLKVNHVVCDAHGAVHLAYLLCRIYNDSGDEDWESSSAAEDRSMRPIWHSLPFRKRLHMRRVAWKYMRKTQAPADTIWSLPFTSRDADGRKMLVMHFDRPGAEKIVEHAKEHGATVNDIFLTAFIRSNHAVLRPKDGIDVPFQVAFDLRQLAPGKGADVANLSSAIFLSFAKDDKETFDVTLSRVVVEMGKAKKEKRAAVGIPLLEMIYSGPRSFRKMRESFESAFEASVKKRHLRPLLTNMGKLDEDKLVFGEIRPARAFVTSPTAYPPLLVMGLSGYDGTFTLTSGFCEYGIDAKIMDKLMKTIYDQLSF